MPIVVGEVILRMGKENSSWVAFKSLVIGCAIRDFDFGACLQELRVNMLVQFKMLLKCGRLVQVEVENCG